MYKRTIIKINDLNSFSFNTSNINNTLNAIKYLENTLITSYLKGFESNYFLSTYFPFN